MEFVLLLLPCLCCCCSSVRAAALPILLLCPCFCCSVRARARAAAPLPYSLCCPAPCSPAPLLLVLLVFPRKEEGDNCGVVDWVDPEWPAALKKALKKVWDMYEKSKIENLVKDEELFKLAEEKKQLPEKYEMNIKLNKDFSESMEKKFHKEHYQKIMNESKGEMLTPEAQKETAKIEKENIMLKKEIEILKHIHAGQAELIMTWRKDATEDVQVVKEEKKKLEYAIADLLQAGEVDKNKIKRIKGNM